MGKLGEVLSNPDELVPMVSMYLAARRAKILPKEQSLAFCYDMLPRVSRSFAVVIQQLPTQLRDAICVFYLVLRALDTVEDDMAIPQDIKIPLLRCFHEKSYDRGWRMDCGAGEYRRLMAEYPLVTDAFLQLDKKFQIVIADICRRMGNGMADFIPQEVKTVEQYNLYCHYVAGLVGIGLSQLFASSGLESSEFGRVEDEANEMGLFLQKTNIIRDYLEDICEEPAPRMFWPREIWGRYAQQLAEFKDPQNSTAAVAALNDMILDALSHIPHCLSYLAKLRHQAVRKFCAIPQIMAMATLQLCYNNHAVFTDILILFRKFAASLACKAEAALAKERGQPDGSTDPLAARRQEVHNKVAEAAVKVVASCDEALQEWQRGQVARRVAEQTAPVDVVGRLGVMVLAVCYAIYTWHIDQFRSYLGLPTSGSNVTLDQLNRLLAVALLMYAAWVGITGKRM